MHDDTASEAFTFPHLRAAIEDVYHAQGFSPSEAVAGAWRYIRQMTPELVAALAASNTTLQAARHALAAQIGPPDESPDVWAAVNSIEEAARMQGVASGFTAAGPFVVLPQPGKEEAQ